MTDGKPNNDKVATGAKKGEAGRRGPFKRARDWLLGTRPPAGERTRLERARDCFFGIPTPVQSEWSGSEPGELRERRDRTEDIANQRIGFMLVFVALVVGGAFAANNAVVAKSLLAWGFVICVIIVPTIWRAHTRHRFVCSVLETAFPEDIATKVAGKLKPRRWSSSKKDWIGYCLPPFVALSLLLCAIGARLNWLPLGGEKEKTAISVRCEEDADGNFVIEFLDDDRNLFNKQALTPAAGRDLRSQLLSAVTAPQAVGLDDPLPNPRPEAED